MTEAKAVSTRLRFEIFKRDSFVCQYCGRTPPEVILQIDHIRPRADGGGNESINLVTSCRDCNSGKSDRKLIDKPRAIEDVLAEQTEKIAQLAAFNELLRQAHKIELTVIDDVVAHWERCGGDGLDHQQLNSCRVFLKRLGFAEVTGAIDCAGSRYAYSSRMFKYFCGICWRKIKDKEGVVDAKG